MLWKWQTNDNSIVTFFGHMRPVSTTWKCMTHVVCFLLQKESILSCSEDNTLCIWETKSGKCLLTLNGHTDKVRHNACSSFIISASFDKTLKVWDSQTRKCVQSLNLEGHGTWGRVITLSAAVFQWMERKLLLQVMKKIWSYCLCFHP